jgi:hypothetical protein
MDLRPYSALGEGFNVASARFTIQSANSAGEEFYRFTQRSTVGFGAKESTRLVPIGTA